MTSTIIQHIEYDFLFHFLNVNKVNRCSDIISEANASQHYAKAVLGASLQMIYCY
jgi:hypothetical protein